MFFRLEVAPEAKRESLARVAADKFKATVREKAVGNLANRRALNLLAEHLKVAPADLKIITGHHRPHKIVQLRSPRP